MCEWRYGQAKGGQKLHLVYVSGTNAAVSQPLCGRYIPHYRMTINVPLAHACRNCVRVARAREKREAQNATT